MAGGKGELNCSAKLTEDDVKEILFMNETYKLAMDIANENNLGAIARKFGISRNHAYRITSRKKWRHVQI